MHVLEARGEESALAGPDARAAMAHDGERLIRDLEKELGLRAHGLDHHHFRGDAGAGEVDVLRPDAVLHALAWRRASARNRPAGPQGFYEVIAIRTLKHVHCRRADELRHEQVRRPVVELERLAELLDAALVHDGDAVGHGHGLDLVWGQGYG